MAISFERRDETTVRFSLGEFGGAVGDAVTVLPVVVALAALTELSLAWMLVWFGAFQVVWGLHYGVPLSVEPMKALAALAIAGALTVDELVVAGLLAGAVLLLAGRLGMIGRFERHVGTPVVRGVQVAVALVLLETGLGLGLRDPALAAGAVGLVGLLAVVGWLRESPLALLVVGGGLALLAAGIPTPALPTPALSVPTPAALTADALGATGAQLAMTVGNAAIATALLVDDLFERDVSPDALAGSMGVMSLVAVPLGGLPMCHGSGGVAGKYAFGARTAGANLLLGAGYLLAAVVATGLVAAFPMALLGVVLALIALRLARSGLDTDHRAVALGIGVLGLLTNVGLAFVVGAVAWLAVGWVRDGRDSGRRA